MINILMYISSGLILSGFIGYLLLILINNKRITNVDGFNITKDILNEYDSINIIENKSFFTVYNLKRKVIKIASKCYYGKSVSDLSIPLMEAGILVVDNGKNKFILFMKKILSNLKLLYILPIIAVIFNGIDLGTIDAKIGIIFVGLLCVISYLLINVKTTVNIWIYGKMNKNKEITKKEKSNINNFLNKVLLCDKLIFIGELVMIIRFIAIILYFN